MTDTGNGVIADTLLVPDVSSIEETLKKKHEEVSVRETPKGYVKQRQGFDYVEEGYMRNVLNEQYPIWSWEIIKYELLGTAWVSVHGRLKIIDGGISRSFDSVSAHRIQSSRASGDFVDIGNDMKAANSDAFKVAVNRLCNIADDVYRKAYGLTEKQKESLFDMLSDINDEEVLDKVTQGVEDCTINRSNFNRTVKWLTTQIGE